MSLPYMPFYVSDFEGDTAHLSLAEDGAYNRLLRLCWRTPGCSIPDDDAWIQRRMRVSEQDFREIVRPILDEFFEVKKARLFSPKLLKIFRESKITHKKRSEAGKKGGRPVKSMKSNETDERRAVSPAKAGIKPGQSNQNHNQVNNKPPIVPLTVDPPTKPKTRRNKTRLPDDFVLTDEMRSYAVAQGMPAQEVDGEFEAFRNHHTAHGSLMANWAAAWQTWCRNYRRFNKPSNPKTATAESTYW